MILTQPLASRAILRGNCPIGVNECFAQRNTVARDQNDGAANRNRKRERDEDGPQRSRKARARLLRHGSERERAQQEDAHHFGDIIPGLREVVWVISSTFGYDDTVRVPAACR